MSKETAAERLERLKREKAASKEASTDTAELVSQLTHETTGEPDFSAIAKRLEERKAQEAKGENEGHVKMTIYVRSDVAEAFNALITKRGQQKEFVNQALIDFIQKKIRELDIK
jgi:hypothetical protein